mmetsp:Transcript_18145/g.39560  ORF Transcript_18145/g.39560 Transcript_18145/m.39560 type:complete len:174 (-) Transcript_18145:389-910(-)
MPEHDINDIDDVQEQYRMMAQMEAVMRVKDNTGFDMVEYKQQYRLLEEQRHQEEMKATLPSYTKPAPNLPESRNFNGSDGSSPGAQEPPLPFTRANRRYGKNARNRNGRVQVPEISMGVIVLKNSTTATTESSRDDHAVTCWGCGSVSETYLRVNVLSTLVQCPECLTVSPVT